MIGERIKLLREKRGMSQFDLAIAINVAQSSVGNYERETRAPDSDTIIEIAKYFDVSADYLLGLTNDPKRQPNATDTLGLSYDALDRLEAWNTQYQSGRYRRGKAGLSILGKLIMHADFLALLSLVQDLLDFSASDEINKYTRTDMPQELVDEVRGHGYEPVRNSIFRKSTILQIKDRFGTLISSLAQHNKTNAAKEYCKQHGLDYHSEILSDILQDSVDYHKDQI